MDCRCDTTTEQQDHAGEIDPKKQSHDRSENTIERVEARECSQIRFKDIPAQFEKRRCHQGCHLDLAEAHGSAWSKLIKH
jgi:hypothetical protein